MRRANKQQNMPIFVAIGGQGEVSRYSSFNGCCHSGCIVSTSLYHPCTLFSKKYFGPST